MRSASIAARSATVPPWFPAKSARVSNLLACCPAFPVPVLASVYWRSSPLLPAPILLRLPRHGRCIRVLHFKPIQRAAGAVRRVLALRDDAFEPHLAGMGEDRRAVALDMFVEPDTETGPGWMRAWPCGPGERHGTGRRPLQNGISYRVITFFDAKLHRLPISGQSTSVGTGAAGPYICHASLICPAEHDHLVQE